ncbi:MAG: fluoride efflux transporter FluC [Blastococcus sp.]
MTGVADAAAPPRRRVPDPAVLVAVSLGGVLGAEARYGMSVALPHEPTQIPVSTWLVNTSGCLLIGILMTVVMELSAPHRLVRPFLGVGVLGGYTTFSTATVEVQQLTLHGRPGLALGYLVGTVVAALVAVTAGMVGTRALGGFWVRRRSRRGTPS